MNFFYINIFLLFVSLRHFISLYKDYNKKYIYTNEIYNSFFNLKIKRSLAQHGKNKSMKRSLTRNSLTKEKRLNDKLSKRNDEIDKVKNGHNMDENLQDQKERNYAVNKKLKNEYEKYNIKNSSSESIHFMTRFKNWLYRKIFKERNFWAYISSFTGALGGAAGVSFFSTICAACSSAPGASFLPIFGGIWGVLVLIIILILIGTWMLVTWLWKHKEVYNETCGK